MRKKKKKKKKQVFPAASKSKLDTTSCFKTSPAGQQSTELTSLYALMRCTTHMHTFSHLIRSSNYVAKEIYPPELSIEFSFNIDIDQNNPSMK